MSDTEDETVTFPVRRGRLAWLGVALGSVPWLLLASDGNRLALGLAVLGIGAAALALVHLRRSYVRADAGGLLISRGVRGSEQIAWSEIQDIAADDQRLHIVVTTRGGRRIETGLDPGPDRELLVLWRRRRR